MRYTTATCWHVRCAVAGWFKLKDGKLFPGQSPRRFFESDREHLHTSSMSPYEDLTELFFFCMIFRRLRVFGKIGSPQIKRIRRKQRRKPPDVRPRDGHTYGTRAKLQGLSLKNGVAIWTHAAKCIICVAAFNYIVSVYNNGPTQSDLRIFARNFFQVCLREPAIGSFRKKKLFSHGNA